MNKIQVGIFIIAAFFASLYFIEITYNACDFLDYSFYVCLNRQRGEFLLAVISSLFLIITGVRKA